MMMMNHKKINKNKRSVDLLSSTASIKNISTLPTNGVSDHTNRPGIIERKAHKLTFKQDFTNEKDVALGPIY